MLFRSFSFVLHLSLLYFHTYAAPSIPFATLYYSVTVEFFGLKLFSENILVPQPGWDFYA